MEAVADAAVERVEQAGIIFVDEIDKIAGREGSHGPEVSREGVQRDILPIVEGTTVNTKHGMVRTDHILFIAAGAFHVSKPSDLIPELQGRFPIRVELEALGQAEFVRILTEPRSALIKQYMALMATEGVDLTFTEDGVATIAEFATIVNERTENIGARRLHTVMERLLDEVSFEAPNLQDKIDYDRRSLRPTHAGGHRQERRSLALHPVTHSTRMAAASRRHARSGQPRCCCWRSLRASPVERRDRRWRRSCACRRKWPPSRRSASASDVYRVVRGAVDERRRPEARRHRSGGGLRRHVDAIAPATEEQRELATLIATLPVRPILPELPVPANGSAPPPLPLPPGVDRGAAVAVREAVDRRDSRRRWSCRWTEAVRSSSRRRSTPNRPIGPLVAPAPTQLPRRHYFVIGEKPARPRERAIDAGLDSARSRQLGAGCAGRHQHGFRDDDHLAAIFRCADLDVPAAADGEAGRRRECHAVERHPEGAGAAAAARGQVAGLQQCRDDLSRLRRDATGDTRRAGSATRSRCRRRSRRRRSPTPSS